MNYYLINSLAAGMSESIDRSQSIGERLALGGQTLLLGMGIVMLVLAFLWGVLELFRVIFYKPVKPIENTVAVPVVPIEEASAEQNLIPETPYETESDGDNGSINDEELVAVITAAAAAYLEAENSDGSKPRSVGGFRVVSYRKITRNG